MNFTQNHNHANAISAHKTTGVAADGDLEDMMAELSEGRPTDQQPERMSHEMADILVVNSTVEGKSWMLTITISSLAPIIDHNALISIVSFNLQNFRTTITLYHWIPYFTRIIDLQSSCSISCGERRIRSSKFLHYENGWAFDPLI